MSETESDGSRRASYEILLRVKVLQFSCETASYELVIKVIRTWNRKRGKRKHGFHPSYRIGPFCSRNKTTITHSGSYLAERFIARARRAGCRLHSWIRREKSCEEERRRSEISRTQNRRGRPGGFPRRILESIHYSARTATWNRAPSVSAILFTTRSRNGPWPTMRVSPRLSARIFPHDSLASPLFPPPSRPFRRTSD